MRLLKKNERPFYYQLYEDVTMLKASTGYYTGEKGVSYSDPVKLMGNISAVTGESVVAEFGTYDDYSKVILLTDMTCPIDENSVLWIDRVPTYDGEGNLTNTPDYVVRHVAKTLNVIAYAIAKVDVSA